MEENNNRSSNCFDPFRDYFELSSVRTTDVFEHESPLPGNLDSKYYGGSSCWNGNALEHNNPGHPSRWMPKSLDSASRPLLGRRPSTDDGYHSSVSGHDDPLHSCNLPTPDHGLALTVKDSVPALQDHGAWARNCSAWTDINSEINAADEHRSRLTTPRLTTPKIRSEVTKIGNLEHMENGQYMSTGFFNNNNERGNCSSGILNWNGALCSQSGDPSPIATYPRYSSGFDVENPRSWNQMAALFNRLLQEGQGQVGGGDRQGYRNQRILEEGKFCAFCKKNGERKEFYSTHVLKDSWGKAICPILRSYVCPICGASGDGAHTLRHCPMRTNLDLMSSAR